MPVSTHFYENNTLDIGKICNELEEFYAKEDFEVQHTLTDGEGVLQMKKNGVLPGLGQALTVRLHQVGKGLQSSIGVEDWADKVKLMNSINSKEAVEAIDITSLIGAVEELHLARQLREQIDQMIREQVPNIKID